MKMIKVLITDEAFHALEGASINKRFIGGYKKEDFGYEIEIGDDIYNYIISVGAGDETISDVILRTVRNRAFSDN